MIGTDGTASPVIHYVGPFLQQRDGEGTAVPELRVHAARAAEVVVASLLPVEAGERINHPDPRTAGGKGAFARAHHDRDNSLAANFFATPRTALDSVAIAEFQSQQFMAGNRFVLGHLRQCGIVHVFGGDVANVEHHAAEPTRRGLATLFGVRNRDAPDRRERAVEVADDLPQRDPLGRLSENVASGSSR